MLLAFGEPFFRFRGSHCAVAGKLTFGLNIVPKVDALPVRLVRRDPVPLKGISITRFIVRASEELSGADVCVQDWFAKDRSSAAGCVQRRSTVVHVVVLEAQGQIRDAFANSQ